MVREPIREFGGRIIGWVDTDNQGNKTVRNFNYNIVAYYNKERNETRDFYGVKKSDGDTTMMYLERT